MRYSFYDDYSEGAHPSVLDALVNHNDDQQSGYGNDDYCKQAATLITKRIGQPTAAIHFVPTGSGANVISLNALCSKPYESVIAAVSGHINVHETGALEASGHKINQVQTADGKITAKDVREVYMVHSGEHFVQPRVVYISQLTELGTMYSREELESLASVCKELGLLLYLDGARLGCALTSPSSDVTIEDIARLCDVFYIGGTKNGALFGEAIVIVNEAIQKDFRFYIKQRCALMAKGRAIGIQFLALFTDDLYFELARRANTLAAKLAVGIRDAGYDFLTEAAGNQLFPILPNEMIDRLKKEYGFHVWSKVDDERSCVRLVTSWATKEEMVDAFLQDLQV